MAIEDIDNLTRPLSDLVGEQGEKAARRKKQLAEVRATRAAGMTADEAKAAAERGDFGDVGQDSNDFLENLMGLQGGDVSQLDLTKAQRQYGMLPKSPIDDAVRKGLGFFFRKTPLGAAITYGPEIVRSIKNFMKPADQAVTDTGEILTIKPEDFGITSGAGKAPVIDLTDKNIVDILEKARTGKIPELQAALQIQKLFPGSGMIKMQPKNPQGFTRGVNFKPLFDEYITKTKANDIFEVKIINDKKSAISRVNKNNIMSAKNIADKDLSDVSYAIKFRNALSNFYPVRKKDTYSSVDEAFYDRHDGSTINNAKAIFEYLGIKPSILDMPVSTNESGGLKLWNKIKTNSDDPVKGEALGYFKKNIIFDNTGKTFQQIKNNLIKNNEFVSSKLLKTKDLFENQSKPFFDVDHIQAPRFGGTNAESNLQLLPVGEHGYLKALSPEKTMTAQAVKAKTNFENEFYRESMRIVDLIKKGDEKKALEMSSKLDIMVNNFKNTFKNTNFKLGEPHLAKKTGERTGEYIKYSDKLNLSKEQKKLVDSLLNKEEYSNLKNIGKTIEQQASEISDMYQQMALISPTGKIPDKPLKIPGDITSMDIPLPAGQVDLRKDVISFKKDGGIMSMKEMTRPLDGQR